jgi:lycopene beta-cyclase
LLKKMLLQKAVKSGVSFMKTKGLKVEHSSETSVVHCGNDVELRASLVLDAAGFSKTLVEYAGDKSYSPGYQGAYGVMVEVESHPFPLDKMLFMDWRDSHLDDAPAMKAANAKLPTFLYVMPFSPTKIFVEETSLVAKPAISFPELKERLDLRMKHLGIKVPTLPQLGSNLSTPPFRATRAKADTHPRTRTHRHAHGQGRARRKQPEL